MVCGVRLETTDTTTLSLRFNVFVGINGRTDGWIDGVLSVHICYFLHD